LIHFKSQTMKKTILIALLAILCLSVKAQDKIIDTVPKIGGIYEYQEVVNLDSTYKKDFLYKNAKIYFVNNFKSANSVIQYDSKEDGKIIGKGNLNVYDTYILTPFDWQVNFSTEISCKDGRYRYRIYDINIVETRHIDSQYGGDQSNDMTLDDAILHTKKGTAKKITARLYNKMVTQLKLDILALKADMSKKDAIAKDDF